MKKFNKVSTIAVSALALIFGLFAASSANAATAPTLGAAASYAAFGKAGVTNNSAAGTTHIWGSVGADDVTTVTNFATSQIGGNKDTGVGVGADALTAYGDLASQAATGSLDLAGTNTVAPGVYTVGASTLDGTLTLNGAGVYIFRSSSSVSVSAGARMILTNGATPCNVFWQIPISMTIGAGAQVVGTIITNSGDITLGDSTTLQGRALALVADVTLINDQITQPTCSASSSSSASQDIKVTKTASKTDLKSGPEKVTFTYRVSNTGDTALTDVTLDDNKCDDVDRFSGDNNDNDIMETYEAWNYRCTKTVKETETNVATAKGRANGVEVKATDRVTVTVSTPGLPNAGANADETSTNFFNTLIQQVISFFSLAK